MLLGEKKYEENWKMKLREDNGTGSSRQKIDLGLGSSPWKKGKALFVEK